MVELQREHRWGFLFWFAETALALACGVALSVRPVGAATKVYPVNRCVSTKLRASAQYCRNVFQIWAAFEGHNDATKRDTALGRARTRLANKWSAAEAKAFAQGSDCSDTTTSATNAATIVDTWVATTMTQMNTGLTLSDPGHLRCSRSVLRAAAARCSAFLAAEGMHLLKLAKDPQGTARQARRSKASQRFSSAWTKATAANCPTTASDASLQSTLDDAVDAVIEQCVVSPNVPDSSFLVVSPSGPVPYLGQVLTPRCAFDTPFHFFAKRGSENKLLIYYQGGGACWNYLTCGFLQTFDSSVDLSGSDNPNNVSYGGFGNPSHPLNPFANWSVVFVPYCTGDLHFGDADRTYTVGGTVTVLHRGYHNARVVEKWAREHFVNPTEIFVTGTSAGAYGALFNAPLHHDVWPASVFSVLGDAGNGVITPDFLANEFPTWNFIAHVPPAIPGVIAAMQGGGMASYVAAVANYFPNTAWAQYTTAFDGGTGGQTGFYNVMLNPNNVFQWPNWWNASCAWNAAMVQQAITTYAAAPANYRYYIGAGSRHGMWFLNKVYTDQSGGESMTIVDWIQAMRARSASWTNVTCTDCGKVLSGDPKPSPLQLPFVADSTSPSGARIQCP